MEESNTDLAPGLSMGKMRARMVGALVKLTKRKTAFCGQVICE